MDNISVDVSKPGVSMDNISVNKFNTRLSMDNISVYVPNHTRFHGRYFRLHPFVFT